MDRVFEHTRPQRIMLLGTSISFSKVCMSFVAVALKKADLMNQPKVNCVLRKRLFAPSRLLVRSYNSFYALAELN